jgi:hypothetical protein
MAISPARRRRRLFARVSGFSIRFAAGTAPAFAVLEMAPWLRVILWVAAVVVPGGMLLVPLLAADALRRRRSLAA